MAEFHASLTTLKRSQGRSAVAAGAYRLGVRLRDHRAGRDHDYTARRDIAWRGIIAPHDAPAELRDPEALLNAMERAERRRDARVAREAIVMLPIELERDQQVMLAQQIALERMKRYSVAVVVGVHDGHVHLLESTRSVSAAGLGAKLRELDEPKRSGAALRCVPLPVKDTGWRA